jgi:NADH-quinone oxidoreductase subunit L
VARAALAGGARTVQLQTGYVYHYAFAMLIGVVLLVGLYLFVIGG